jgi:hypothetical protein
MTVTSDTFDVLRRANPRSEPGFEPSVRAAEKLRERIVVSAPDAPSVAGTVATPARGSRARLGAAAVATMAVGIFVAILAIGVLGGAEVDSASAAVNHAAAVTAETAGTSGTATVLMTLNGETWAGKTVRWNDGNLSLLETGPTFGRTEPYRETRVVDDILYDHDPADGHWVVLGATDSIDPDSGTTPDEYLAVTRADVGGNTLERISAGMTDLAMRQLDDGSTVYNGTVAAGLVAPESGFKEGEHIRVFPFGYVAHDEAADPDEPLEVSITVDAGGLIRELAVAWGGSGSAWTYTVTYSDLGATAPIVAPDNAQPFPPRTTTAPPTG